MAGDQISTPVGEPGFTIGSFLLRLVLALVVVIATFNPSGMSYFHWARDAFLASSLGPLHAVAGIVLLIGWVLFVNATRNSLGFIGVVLVVALFASLVWMLTFYNVIKDSSGNVFVWITLVGVAVVLTAGMSWGHIRRRLSGQATVDEVDH